MSTRDDGSGASPGDEEYDGILTGDIKKINFGKRNLIERLFFYDDIKNVYMSSIELNNFILTLQRLQDVFREILRLYPLFEATKGKTSAKGMSERFGYFSALKSNFEKAEFLIREGMRFLSVRKTSIGTIRRDKKGLSVSFHDIMRFAADEYSGAFPEKKVISYLYHSVANMKELLVIFKANAGKKDQTPLLSHIRDLLIHEMGYLEKIEDYVTKASVEVAVVPGLHLELEEIRGKKKFVQVIEQFRDIGVESDDFEAKRPFMSFNVLRSGRRGVIFTKDIKYQFIDHEEDEEIELKIRRKGIFELIGQGDHGEREVSERKGRLNEVSVFIDMPEDIDRSDILVKAFSLYDIDYEEDHFFDYSGYVFHKGGRSSLPVTVLGRVEKDKHFMMNWRSNLLSDSWDNFQIVAVCDSDDENKIHMHMVAHTSVNFRAVLTQGGKYKNQISNSTHTYFQGRRVSLAVLDRLDARSKNPRLEIRSNDGRKVKYFDIKFKFGVRKDKHKKKLDKIADVKLVLWWGVK